MYPINNTALELFKSSQRQLLNITVTTSNDTLTITEADIKQGTFVINRYSASTERIEIGSAIAAELVMVLNNSEGDFNDVDFEGAELYVQVGVKDWSVPNSTTYWIPMGYFTVDSAPRKFKDMTITALDRMVQFDKEVDLDNLYFPVTAGALLERICDICNIQLLTDTSTLPNHSYSITAAPVGDTLTYRQYLVWLNEIFGKCAFINWRGELEVVWYDYHNVNNNNPTYITASDRFSSDIDENDITITGVQIRDNEQTYLAGTNSYVLNIEGNGLITHDFQSVASTIFSNVGITYTPYSFTTKPLPNIYPLDKILFTDNNGIGHMSIITDVTFTLNKTTVMQGKGESAKRNGYATANPLTSREVAVINEMKQEVNKALNDRVQTVLAFNELISNALGLYSSGVEQTDGSTIYYMHNQAQLEESMVIFTMTAEGIAWTSSGWNGGSPVWSYGVTTAGNALFKMLSAEGIEVSKAGEDYNIEVTPRAFSIYYKDMLVTKIEADEMNVPKILVEQYLEIGKIRFVPYYQNNVLIGTNIVFVD